jgi:hypothetical protein
MPAPVASWCEKSSVNSGVGGCGVPGFPGTVAYAAPLPAHTGTSAAPSATSATAAAPAAHERTARHAGEPALLTCPPPDEQVLACTASVRADGDPLGNPSRERHRDHSSVVGPADQRQHRVIVSHTA